MIKRFKINKLFGFRDINIPFKSNIKVLIGENGLGKTTVLNILYYVLKQKYAKLIQIDFESLELEFRNKKIIRIVKTDLESYLKFIERSSRSSARKRIQKAIDIKDLEQFVNQKSKGRDNISSIIEKYLIDKQIANIAPRSIIIQELTLLLDPGIKIFAEYNETLRDLDFELLYFPTYRRVEEDFKNLGKIRKHYVSSEYDDDEIYLEQDFEENLETNDDDTLIHFGMEDVVERLERTKEEIKESTITGFSKVTGELLSQLLQGFRDITPNEIKKLNVESAKIVLHRVGNNLSQQDREEILRLLGYKKELREKKELVHFLFKLIQIYDLHKHKDDSIKQFIDVCNKYLEDKKFKYDESSVSIDLLRVVTLDPVTLNKLSSGEKQIVSLFSKIYLENRNNIIVLFDEPELSLSIEWQKNLLPDIVNSNKCKFLLSVTHSPFIFKNELDKFAVGMNVYVRG